MARTQDVWETTGSEGTYIKTIAPAGFDILINGSSKYLNFNQVSGINGYGFRDNDGTMQFRNYGGSWTDIGTGGDSFWGTVTGGINYAGGMVGIGVSGSLLGKLHIVEAGATRPNIYAANSDNSGNDIAQFWAQNLTLGVGINYQGIRQNGTNASLTVDGNGTGNIYLNGVATGKVAVGSISNTLASKFNVLGNLSVGDSSYYTTAAPTNGAIIQGNVGIGNNNPTEKLNVTGNILASGTIIGSNLSGTNTGDNSANSLYSGLAASKADVGQTFYIGTTQVAINRASAALTLAGMTLTTPDIGTPSAGVVTNLSGTASININGTVGATTPTTVVGTTITANTGIVLPSGSGIKLTLPAGDALVTGPFTDSFQSGYTAAAGDLVFMGSASKWLEVDADAVATCKGLMGIAMEAKNDTQAMKVALPGSMVRFNAFNWTVGATLYAGETLGGIQETIPTGADAIIRVIGFAVDADTIYFNPSSDQQSTVA